MAYDYINFSCQISDSPGIYASLTDCENAVNDGSVKPVLILNPLWTANKRISLPLIISALGDGYKQTVFQGLTENEEWDITSPLLTETEVNQLLNQLQRLSGTSFLWSPNNGVIPWREYACDEWQKIRIDINQYQITTKFIMTILGSGLIIPTEPVEPSVPPILLTRAGDVGSNTVTDISIYNNSISANGNTGVSSVGYFNNSKSISFDGNGDYLLSTSFTAFTLGDGEFAIEMFVRPTNISVPQFGSTLIGNYYYAGTGSSDLGWFLSITSSGLLRFFSGGNGSYLFNLAASANAIANNTWNYIGVKREIVSGNRIISLWKDGSQVASATGNFNENYTRSLKIGTQEATQTAGFPTIGATNTSFTGLIDENIRITVGATKDLSIIPSDPFTS